MTAAGVPPGGPRPSRAWLWRFALAISVCLLAVAWLWAARTGHPSDGTVVLTTSPGWRPDGVVISRVVGADNPLRVGDLVTAVDGHPLAAGSPADSAHIGDVLIYDLVRDGQRLRVPVTLTDYPFWKHVAHHASTLPDLTFLILLPSLVVARRPRDPAAVALYTVAVLSIIGHASIWYGTQVIDVATGRMWVTAVAEVANCLIWATMLNFAALFPQPWPVLRRRFWLLGIAYAGAVLAYGVQLAVWLSSEEGLRRSWSLVVVSRPAAAVFPVLIVAAVVTSYFLARDPIARQRVRLALYALGLLAGGYFLLGRLPDMLLGHPLVPWEYFSLVVIPAQVLFTAALLRYRMWDIQIILRRSLLNALIAIALIGAYMGVISAVGAVVDVQIELGPTLAAIAIAIALSFAALFTALRRLVSRLVYGEREDPYAVLRQLGGRLESAASASVVLNQLVVTLVRTLRLAHAAVEVPGLDLASSGHGEPGPTATSIDLIHDGERIGRLVLDPGPDREPFGASDRRLIEGLAQQVSATAHGLLLAARLRRSLEGTVTALEEERRRLRREIHDGLGPTIASASMRMELGRSLVRTDPDAAERILADLAEVHRSVVLDIRKLVDGLRPTVLDHLSLPAALRELVDRLDERGNTTLHCAIGMERLPAAVEVAAYRIVSESLTNVVRHARATTCEVRVWHDTDLHIEISDDGQGLPPVYRPGMGLTSIRERCAELGGWVQFSAVEPRGTKVACRIPVAGGWLQP